MTKVHRIVVAVAVTALLGNATPAAPSVNARSCKPHPRHVVNPGCASEVSSPPEAYPDLVPDVEVVQVVRPINGVDPDTGQFTYGPPELWFDTRSHNRGAVPFDVLADDPTNAAGSTVSQCVAWTAGAACRQRRTIGGFVWHEAHGHFHYEDFASYALRKVNSDGVTVDRSAAGLVAVSEKVSFCLLDSEQVDPAASPVPRYLACNNINQGISPGWSDVYTADLPGQQFPLAGVPDGRYALIVDMDTADQVFESLNTNNHLEVIVDLRVGENAVDVLEKRRT